RPPLNEQAATILGVQAPGYKTYTINLTKFITHLHSKVEPQTITSYLAALRHYHDMNHMDWSNVRYDPLIKQLLKTIQGNHTFKVTQQKEHITREQLQKMKLRLDLADADDLLFLVVALVAFYGLARLGELLPGLLQDTAKIP
ncbi:21152_t:CDS:2, partial [Racocetra persica]